MYRRDHRRQLLVAALLALAVAIVVGVLLVS